MWNFIKNIPTFTFMLFAVFNCEAANYGYICAKSALSDIFVVVMERSSHHLYKYLSPDSSVASAKQASVCKELGLKYGVRKKIVDRVEFYE